MRRLRGVGRFVGTPEHVYIEIRDGEYVVLTDGSEVQSAEHRALVERYLLQHPGSTVDAITEGTGIIRTSLLATLAELTRPPMGTVTRSGGGVRGDPYRYRIGPEDVANPVSGDAGVGAAGAATDSGRRPGPPASPGPFPTASRAHGTGASEGYSTGAPFLLNTPIDHPRSRVVDARDTPPTGTEPKRDLVAAAMSVFGDAIDPDFVTVDVTP